MTEENKAKCRQIANHYGYLSQREMLVEECAELIQAIQKLKRAEKESLEKEFAETMSFVEELADVTIMVEQMNYLYGIAPTLVPMEEYELTITKKLDRQLQRIREEQIIENHERKDNNETDIIQH